QKRKPGGTSLPHEGHGLPGSEGAGASGGAVTAVGSTRGEPSGPLRGGILRSSGSGTDGGGGLLSSSVSCRLGVDAIGGSGVARRGVETAGSMVAAAALANRAPSSRWEPEVGGQAAPPALGPVGGTG